MRNVPLGSLGRLRTKSTARGRLYGARRSRQYAGSSSALTSAAAGWTTARTRSPLSGSGTPITAASATPGVHDQDVPGLLRGDGDPTGQGAAPCRTTCGLLRSRARRAAGSFGMRTNRAGANGACVTR